MNHSQEHKHILKRDFKKTKSVARILEEINFGWISEKY